MIDETPNLSYTIEEISSAIKCYENAVKSGNTVITPWSIISHLEGRCGCSNSSLDKTKTYCHECGGRCYSTLTDCCPYCGAKEYGQFTEQIEEYDRSKIDPYDNSHGLDR